MINGSHRISGLFRISRPYIHNKGCRCLRVVSIIISNVTSKLIPLPYLYLIIKTKSTLDHFQDIRVILYIFTLKITLKKQDPEQCYFTLTF